MIEIFSSSPWWIYLIIAIVFLFIGFVIGVIRTYSKTIRLGDLHVIFDPEEPEPYLFVGLEEPITRIRPPLEDGVEVLMTVRIKNKH